MSSRNPTIKGVIKTNTILDEFIYRNSELLGRSKKQVSLHKIRQKAEMMQENNNRFFTRLSERKHNDKLGLIAEIKKSSPSAGRINGEVDVQKQARLYEENGASAISVLTQPFKFNGTIGDLAAVCQTVSLPVLRKDFIFDPYQIYEAKWASASAILLIVMSLKKPLLMELLSIAHSVGLDVLMETHDEAELTVALETNARIIGVNARNLQTMKTDLATTERLLPLVPHDKIRVAESGILSANDAQRVREVGADAILVGSAIMASENPQKKIKELLNV